VATDFKGISKGVVSTMSQPMTINNRHPRYTEREREYTSEEKREKERIRKKVDTIRDAQALGEWLSDPWDD
jgi:hypothetical protein